MISTFNLKQFGTVNLILVTDIVLLSMFFFLFNQICKQIMLNRKGEIDNLFKNILIALLRLSII